MAINLQRNNNGVWAVVAKGGASMWAPGLSAEAKLVATRTSGARGEVLDRNGVPIMSVGKVYDVSIDPARASPQTVAELEKLVNEPAGSLVTRLTAAKTAHSIGAIPVITLRAAALLEPQAAAGRPHRGDLPFAAAAAGHPRPTAAWLLWSGDLRNDQERQGPLCRR
jgi:hypothetical protein